MQDVWGKECLYFKKEKSIAVHGETECFFLIFRAFILFLNR